MKGNERQNLVGKGGMGSVAAGIKRKFKRCGVIIFKLVPLIGWGSSDCTSL